MIWEKRYISGHTLDYFTVGFPPKTQFNRQMKIRKKVDSDICFWHFSASNCKELDFNISICTPKRDGIYEGLQRK